MTNPVYYQTQQPPSYSGVTINITNPAALSAPIQYPVSRNGQGNIPTANQPILQQQYINKGEYLEPVNGYVNDNNMYKSDNIENSQAGQAYPQQYYVNNYNTQAPANNGNQAQYSAVQSQYASRPENNPNVIVYNPGVQPGLNHSDIAGSGEATLQAAKGAAVVNESGQGVNAANATNTSYIQQGVNNSYAADTMETSQGVNYSNMPDVNGAVRQGLNNNGEPQNRIAQAPAFELKQSSNDENADTSTSKEIIEELDLRNAEEKELEKNGQKVKIVALTNEYIMSLENYLNNPNTDIRLMAAKEVLTRLDEDKSRYDDAALNALINKMLQDPNKLIRIAAMSALSSELASGNDYTVQLLNQIQQNPEADPEDVLEVSQILLKRSAATEVKYTPVQNQPVQQNQEAEIQ